MKKTSYFIVPLLLWAFAPNASAQVVTDEVNVIEGLGGKVGIGTDLPLGKLHVNGAIVIPASGTIDNISASLTAKIGDDFQYDGEYLNQYSFGFHGYNDGTYSFTNPLNTYVSGFFGVDIFTAGLNRLRVSANGKVGIGTAAPSTTLEVNGISTLKGVYVPGKYSGTEITDAAIQLGFASDSYTAIRGSTGATIHMFGANWNSGQISKSANTINLNAPNGVTIGSWDNENLFTLFRSSDGYVGIGTSSPQQKLHVNGGSEILSTGSGAGFRFRDRNSSTQNDWVWYATQNKARFWYSGTGDVITILQNGRVGLGMDSPTQTLSVNGNASKSSAGDWVANSDARLKTKIVQLSSSATLDKLLLLKGVTYEWDDDKTGINRPDGIQYGFTAQNIEEVFPELVEEDNLGYLQTAYGTYDAMMVEALRALNERIEKLEQENALLKQEKQETSASIASILKRLEQIEASSRTSRTDD